MLKCGLLALGAFLAMASPLAAQERIPTVTATYFATPPVLDGKLDDPCWRSAGKAAPFAPTNPSLTLKAQTAAFVGYDASHLYVGFECREPRMDATRAEYRKDGGSVWLDDCIELFVAPHATATHDNYTHFGVNIAGTKTAEHAAIGPSPMSWTARTAKEADRWTVEIAIPFTTLAPLGSNDDSWRINFCRNEIPSGDSSSSWATITDSFHNFWRFGRLLPQPGAPSFTRSRGTLKALASTVRTPAQEFPATTPQVPRPETPIIPAPRQMKDLPGRFALTPQTPIVVGDHATAMDRRPAEEINQELQKVLGYTLPIVPASRWTPGRPAILVGEPWLNPRVKSYCAEQGKSVTKESPGREGYILDASPSIVVIAGSDQAGTFWGAETLRQMIRRDGAGRGFVRCAQIRDWPRFAFRGVHLLPSTDGLAFHTKCIEELFSRYKVNQIIFQAEQVRWDSHPEVYNPSRGMTKDDVRKLIEVAREHHITVTPMIESLGHMEWAAYNGNHRDLFEDEGTPYAFCPRNENGYRFMFDIMDEAIDLFGHPKYLHIGHDEVTNAGRFPVHEECQKIGKYRLYTDDILRYYQHLKEKGVKTMIWGDVLTQEGYRDEISRLPKDIVICDWRYSGVKDFPSLDFYKQAGFPLIACTWYVPDNLYYFSRAGDRDNIEGMCQTTWTGFMPSAGTLASEYYQIYAYVMGAEWAWNPTARTPDRLPYDPELVLAHDFGVSFAMDANSRFFSVPLDAFYDVSRTDSKGSPGWIGLEPGEDISGLPGGSWNLKGIPFRIGPAAGAPAAVVLRGSYATKDLPESVHGIPVGRAVSRLHFLQATGWETGPGVVVGRYVVHYADGSTQEVPLRYGTEIKTWQDDLSTSQANPVAWRGRTASHRPAALWRFTWTNPAPEKEVASVDFEAAGTDASPILVALTAETPR